MVVGAVLIRKAEALLHAHNVHGTRRVFLSGCRIGLMPRRILPISCQTAISQVCYDDGDHVADIAAESPAAHYSVRGCTDQAQYPIDGR
ncbi:hypothetical protein HNP02_007599 [Mycobacterium sp. AZCC_0083]|nr:hypothetical protein [Mycobacterium sp. AZCC_0083]